MSESECEVSRMLLGGGEAMSVGVVVDVFICELIMMGASWIDEMRDPLMIQ